jgi:two-component system response regulator
MTATTPPEPITILLVEDSAGDIALTRRALKNARVANDLHVVGDGADALDFIHQRNGYEDAPRPDLVLLDLNLPRVDGREVLAEIKQTPGLSRIPVVVLTTSAAEQDVLQSYDLHANAYITKPVDFAQFIDAVRSLDSFWLVVVTLPS